MSFELGDAFQFDWSCEYVFVGGIRRRLPTAVRRVGAMPGSGDSRELPLADNRTDPEAHTGERQFELQVLEKLLHSFGGHDCLGQGCNTARKASVIIQVEMLEPMGVDGRTEICPAHAGGDKRTDSSLLHSYRRKQVQTLHISHEGP